MVNNARLCIIFILLRPIMAGVYRAYPLPAELVLAAANVTQAQTEEAISGSKPTHLIGEAKLWIVDLPISCIGKNKEGEPIHINKATDICTPSLGELACWGQDNTTNAGSKLRLLVSHLQTPSNDPTRVRLPATFQVQSGHKAALLYSGQRKLRMRPTPSEESIVAKPHLYLKWLYGFSCQVKDCMALCYVGQTLEQSTDPIGGLTVLMAAPCNHERGTGAGAIRGSIRTTLQHKAFELVNREYTVVQKLSAPTCSFYLLVSSVMLLSEPTTAAKWSHMVANNASSGPALVGNHMHTGFNIPQLREVSCVDELSAPICVCVCACTYVCYKRASAASMYKCLPI